MSKKRRKLTPAQMGAELGREMRAHPIEPPSHLTPIQKEWWRICSEPISPEVERGIGDAILDAAARVGRPPLRRPRGKAKGRDFD